MKIPAGFGKDVAIDQNQRQVPGKQLGVSVQTHSVLTEVSANSLHKY